MTKHASEGEYAELALAVYVEELAQGKRVLYVGDAESAALERLGRGARSVDVVSPRARARGTRRGGRIQPRRWPGADDAGRWDLVIVPDLASAGISDEGKVREVARWLAPAGVLVAGTSDREAPRTLTYEELFDLLDGVFDSVRMIGQAPFAGYSVVDFAPVGELEVTFDGSLLEGAGESAQRYYALCGERDVVLDAYAVVQIPSRAAAVAPAPREERPRPDARVSELSERVREQQDALDAINVHAEEIERELSGVRADLVRAHAELEEARRREAETSASRERLEESAHELRARIEELQKQESFDHEYATLEASLAERGHELTELKAELARRATLVRDLVEELRVARATPAASPSSFPPAMPRPESGEELARSLHTQLDAAVERAVSAEAERAELQFRLDELRGDLAIAENRCAQELEEMQRLEAALRGTVRGLNARLAEVIELHQLTQARLALAEDDRNAAEARASKLARELAEARDQVELEIARERVVAEAREEQGEAPSGAESEEFQQRARVEVEKARDALVQLEQRVEGMRLGYETRIAELRADHSALSYEAERALVQVGELRARLEAKERAEAALRGELAGVHLRLTDREAAVAALRHAAESSTVGAPVQAAAPGRDSEAIAAELEAVRGELARAVEEAETAKSAAAPAARETEALANELEAVRQELSRAREEAQAAKISAAPATPAVELSSVIAARDALAARLQRELADAAERRRGLERRLDECGAKLIAAREELEAGRAVSEVRAHEEQRELGELKDRLERSERERLKALEGLEEARAVLEQLAGSMGAPGAESAPLSPTDGVAIRKLEERISRLDAEASDRELMLRSLTAQLQERDDRLRALERMEAGAPIDDPRALQAKLLEMEERVARLTEELENERDARRRL